MANRSGEWNGVALAGGRYLITARLGTGGMGAVYRAVDRNIDADVVIKVPHQAMLDDPDFAGRFTREIRSLVKLSHPRIVKVTDVGEWDGSPFAVMQFLPGGSLEDRQQFEADGRGIPADPRDVPRWLIGIAQALDYVHAEGYIHRDVKPGNILFDAQGHSFLSDFGVAKVLSESSDPRAARSMTGAGKVLGTPEYMAPELIMGEKVDGRVDQYALAVTVYELLCGRRPFEGEGEIKTRVLVLHTTTPPPPLLEWQPNLPSRLSEAVLKGLAKDPNARYPNCTALAAAVVAAVKEMPARTQSHVRIQCPSCGKSLGVPQAEFAKLQQTGRRVPCPACQHPIQVGSAPAAAITPRSGTMVVPITGDSGGFPAPQPGAARSGTMVVPNAGIPPAPAAARSGTMVVSQPDDAPAAGAGRSGTMIVSNPKTPSATPPAGPGRSGTMIANSPDGPPAPPARRGTTIVSNPEPAGEYAVVEEAEPILLTAVPIGPPAPAAQRAAASAKKSFPPYLWIGLGVAASVLAAGTIAVLALVLGRSSSPTVASVPPEPRSAAPVLVRASNRPATPVVQAQPKPVPVPRAPIQVASVNTPAPGNTTPPGNTPAPARPLYSPPPNFASPRFSGFPTNPPKPGGAVAPARQPSAATPEVEIEADTDAEPSTPSKAETPDAVWSPLIASKKPTRSKETLDKVVADPGRFRNQLVVPDGMYCLEDRARRLPNGSLQLAVSQSRIELARNGSVSVRTFNSTDVQLEPKLAQTLREASRTQPERLDINPAILTLWVTEQGACRLVKAEFLVRFQPRYNPNGLPDVDYFTLIVSPDGTTKNKANDDDWETLPRMLNIKNLCERQLKAWKNMKSNIAQAQMDRQMNSMFSSMMRSAATAYANEQAALRRMHGQ